MKRSIIWFIEGIFIHFRYNNNEELIDLLYSNKLDVAKIKSLLKNYSKFSANTNSRKSLEDKICCLIGI